MAKGGLSGELYRPLGTGQVEVIHNRALDLLEEVGMTYEEGLGGGDWGRATRRT